MDNEMLLAQRRELAATPDLWQFALLSADEITRFAQERSVQVFNGDSVYKLWRLGLLRADLVTSSSRLQIPSIEPIAESSDLYTYVDARRVETRPEGYGGSFANESAESDGPVALFHPFRLYVLYHVARVFGSKVSSTQYLSYPEGLINVARNEIQHLDRWTSSESCAERFEHWNNVAEMAIVLEPTAYSAVFHEIRWRFPETEQGLENKLQRRRESLVRLFSGMTPNVLNKVREDLCQNAELLDGNKLLHVVLRLMSRHERLKLRGELGGSMLFLAMAEIIRRAAEVATGEELPEEDELGFGQWMPGARKSIYGTERILDALRHVRRDLLTSFGLESGIKSRCYVEGETELGALTSAVGEAGGTEFIDVRGQFVERGGKGLAFAASLENDVKAHVFSIVVLDNDSEDNVRAVRNAVTGGRFFGQFYILSPDFEYANFSGFELVEVALDLLAQDGIDPLEKGELVASLLRPVSSTEFFAALKARGFGRLGKGDRWGRALMRFALQHPTLPTRHPKGGEMRPVVGIAKLLVNARDAGYIRSLETLHVDPITGELRPK